MRQNAEASEKSFSSGESVDALITIEQIQTMIEEQRVTTRALFTKLEARAQEGKLTGAEFRLAAGNIAARTVFTLSEILAGCMQATLDLSHVRIAHSIATAGDEGGHGRAEHVHPKMMMDSLNNHLTKAFGTRTIDLKPIYYALQGRHLASELLEHLRLEDNLPDGEKSNMRRHFFFHEKLARLQFLAEDRNAKIEEDDDSSVAEALQSYIQRCDTYLASETILPETIDYCEQQMRLLENPEPGYLAGVNFAHELLADDLFVGLYAVTHANEDRYADDSYKKITYNYIGQHGFYYEKYHGLELDKNQMGVEDRHAEREIMKMREAKPHHLPAAMRGAMDFAKRNANLWKGIERGLTEMQEPQPD